MVKDSGPDDGRVAEAKSDDASEKSSRQLKGVSFSRANLNVSGLSAELQHQEAGNIRLAGSVDHVVDEDRRLREVGSGAAKERPVMERLWSIVASGEVDGVFVEYVDRLYRDLPSLVEFSRLCSAHDVELWVSGGEEGYRVGDLGKQLAGIWGVEGGQQTFGTSVAEEDVIRKVYRMVGNGWSVGEITRLLNRSDG